MPLKSGKSQATVSENISELHSGKTFAHTKEKFGKERANKQAVAIAMSEARKGLGGGVVGFAPGGLIAPGDPNFVKMVQQLLNARGYKLTVDGLSGQNTQGAISDFQVKNGLPATGMADQKTFELLRSPAQNPVPPPIPQMRPPPDVLGQGLSGPAAMMPRLSPGDPTNLPRQANYTSSPLDISRPSGAAGPAAMGLGAPTGKTMDFSKAGPDLWAYPSTLSQISQAGASLNYDAGGAPKKWWGGPLSGIVQSMQKQMPRGLAGALSTNRGSVAPMMPSLSGLMSSPASMTRQPYPMPTTPSALSSSGNFPMGLPITPQNLANFGMPSPTANTQQIPRFLGQTNGLPSAAGSFGQAPQPLGLHLASGGTPQVIKMASPKGISSKIGHISSPKAPRFLRPTPSYRTPKPAGMKAPSPSGMFNDSPVPGTGQTFPGGLAAGGGIEGAGATKVNGGDMLIRSALGLHNLPNNFYYQPSPWPRNYVPPKPTDFEKATPPEMRMHEQDPTKFGYPIAGLLNSTVPGRTDQLPITVASGSYVVPADVISGLGQGNTQGGAHLLEQIIGSPESGSGQGFASGGTPSGHIPIVAAGGEYIIPPKVVARIGQGDEAKGHDILDGMVRKIRTQVAHHMLKLPGPKRD